MALTTTTTTEQVIVKILGGLTSERNKLYNINLESDFLMISGGDTPRWIVPVDKDIGVPVLAQWKPYGVVSQIKWKLLLLFYRLDLLAKIPGVTCMNFADCKKLELASAKSNKTLRLHNIHSEVVPVIYIGTPGPQQKAVVILVDIKSKKSVAIMKASIGSRACQSIIQETEILISLAELGVCNVPKLINMDRDAGLSWQSVLEGKLSSRKLAEEHVKWLIELPKTGNRSSINEQKDILIDLFDSSDYGFPMKLKLQITNALASLSSNNSIDLVLVHGDFAPWNIKKEKPSKLLVIDWEDAIIGGLPLWDLCHFHLIQAHLFNESEVVEQFLSSLYDDKSLAYQYIKEMSLAFSDVKALIILYVLFSVINTNTSSEYSAFLISIFSDVTDL